MCLSPSALHALVQLRAAYRDCTGHNKTLVMLNKRQENWAWMSRLLPHRTAFSAAGTDRRWIYLLLCLCMPISRTQRINTRPREECGEHTNKCTLELSEKWIKGFSKSKKRVWVYTFLLLYDLLDGYQVNYYANQAQIASFCLPCFA